MEGMLRPAGGGIHVVSTGVEELLALQETIYGVSGRAAVENAWQKALQSKQAKVCLLGVPSDTGAGLRKGANHGPNAIRTHLMLKQSKGYQRPDVTDLGLFKH